MIYNYYFAILILALIYFIISNKNPSILISIIIIIIIGSFYYTRINTHHNEIKNKFENKIKTITDDIKDRTYVNNDKNFILNIFPSKLKYIRNDPYLLDLILNIRFIKVFDKTRYTNIVIYIEKFIKVYIYMLSNRYDINIHFQTFIDLRKTIITELYSCFIIIPNKLILIYNINPFKELEKSILDFISYSNNMISIIQKYASQEKKIVWLEDIKYKPFNHNNNPNEVF